MTTAEPPDDPGADAGADRPPSRHADAPVAALLRRAADAVAGAQQYPQPALYIVATPIGNLADLSLRAIAVLARADAIACEDTRHTGTLLQRLGLQRPLLALHAHNEQAASDLVVQRLSRGERVACVSDAGTPAISDPGARLVARVQAAGHRVVPIPGASAAVAAVSVAGLTSTSWTFVGFLPAHGRERASQLAKWLARGESLVLYESPQRMTDLLKALATEAPTRRVTLGRELTKQFEHIQTDTPQALVDAAAQSVAPRGEFVVVVHAPPASAEGDTTTAQARDRLEPATQRMLTVLMRELPLRQAVDLCVAITGEPRKRVYAAALDAAAAPDEADGSAA